MQNRLGVASQYFSIYECRRQSSQKHTSLVCLRETSTSVAAAVKRIIFANVCNTPSTTFNMTGPRKPHQIWPARVYWPEPPLASLYLSVSWLVHLPSHSSAHAQDERLNRPSLKDQRQPSLEERLCSAPADLERVGVDRPLPTASAVREKPPYQSVTWMTGIEGIHLHRCEEHIPTFTTATSTSCCSRL